MPGQGTVVSRIGIYGGTFDPVHVGHLILAEQCREACELDEVWFVPAARPPHKQGAAISAPAARVAMLEFALAGNPAFRISRVELDRSDQGLSYTVTTLEVLAREDSSRELFLLIGADSVRELPTWRNPERILELATVVGVNRGRDHVTEAPGIIQSLGRGEPRLKWVTMPAIELSSTEIRQRVAAGQSIRYRVPRSVEVYIEQAGLYRSDAEGTV